MARLSFQKEKIKVLLLEGVDPSAVDVFRESGYRNIEALPCALEGKNLIEKLEDTFILGIRSRTHLTKEVIEKAPKLFAVGCYCIGTNQIDLREASMNGIPVFNAPHSNTRSVAELVVGLTIMLFRGIFPKNAAAHRGAWLKSAAGSHEVRGKTIGIIGYGHIGSQVSVLSEALGMHVCYYDDFTKLPLGNARKVDSVEELLSRSDLVTLHVPETPQTRYLVNDARLGCMKQGSYLINTSRGSIVDNEALCRFLDNGRIAGAALDVFPKEPGTPSEAFENSLRGRDNVILTPHIGGSTLEAQYNIGLEVTGKLVRYSDTGTSEGAVNFPAINLPLHEGTHRILNIHRNIPGMLQKINKAVADENINVQSQYLLTNQDIGYVVLDIEKEVSVPLRQKLKEIEGTIRTRVLF